jgi:Ca-activated chloride channel family protein
MKRKNLKNFLLIAVLIVATGAAMAYSSNSSGVFSSNRNFGPTRHHVATGGILSISGHLIQDKVLQGSDGTIGLNLTLQAEEATATTTDEARNVDMVIVLDRSGSMKGRKINDARQAVLKLLSNLTSKDRFALVTYSDGVQIASGLLTVNRSNRQRMAAAVNGIRVGGGTNLGAGLQAGINLLRSSNRSTNPAKIILISDGLANKGITDVQSLSGIAAVAVEREFAVSTVGVGAEFNEYLMTAIADQGTGSYYYLENPAAFAEVFQKEFHDARASIVNNLKIQIPLNDGISLADAAGYPISRQNGLAVFYPGSMRSGQTRKLYLTFRVPTNRNKQFELNNLKVVYHHDSLVYETTLEDSFTIACVEDQRKVYSSIDKTSWSDKVINDDFNRLKQEVAADIKSGKKQNAMKRIQTYYGEQKAVNTVVGSASVAKNLDKDLKELETYVEETFQGAPEVIRQKQKSNAKALQYDGYRGRRQ